MFLKETKTLVKIYEGAKTHVSELENFLAAEHGNIAEDADKFASRGEEILSKLREKIDSAEDLVSDEYWPMTSYQKLLGTF